MKVVLLDSHIISGYGFQTEQEIIEGAGHEFLKLTCKNEAEVIEKCLDADVIMNITIRLGEKSIGQLKHCKGMVRYGVGVDEFDVDAATRHGIKVCNVTRYCIEEVALHATSLILSCARQHKHFDACVRAGVWNGKPGRKMRRPSSQTVGLVGFGNIARQAAAYLRAFGYQLIAYDPFLPEEVFSQNQVKQVALDELFSSSDIISLHNPLTKETEGLINKTSIAAMKDGVIIVNTSRGPLIKDEDMVEALQSGKVAAAGLDVMYAEPMKDSSNPYCKLDNVVLTPHISWNTAEASADLFRQVAETAVQLLAGETPYNVLNAKALGLR